MCTFSVRKEKKFLNHFVFRKEICSPARMGIDLLHAARELKWVWHPCLRLKNMAYFSLSVNVTIINPIKVAGFESKECLRSSEIKEDGLLFILRGNEGYLQRELIYKVINSCFRENLVQIYF